MPGLVTIGSAGSVTTEVSLTSSDTGGTLIPMDVTITEADEVHYVDFTFNVEWIADVAATEADGGSPGDLLGVIGTLDVEVESIMIGGTDFVAVPGRSWNGTAFIAEDTLFVTDITAPSTIIGEAAPVSVTLRVEMNQPMDRETYLLISSQVATLNVNFEVTAP